MKYSLAALVVAVCLLTCLVGCRAKDAAPPAASPPPPPAAPAASTPVAPSAPPAAGEPQQVAQAPQTTNPAPATRAANPRYDWPRYFGPDGNGLSTETGLSKSWNSRPPAKLWEVPMSDGGFAGPSAAGGRVYIIDHQGQQDIVRALDFGTGHEQWTYRYDEGGGDNYGYSRATPTVDGNRVYTCSRSGLLLCLDANKGSRLWSRNLASEMGGKRPQWNYAASPVIDGDRVVVIPGSPKGTVAVLNKSNGQTIWQGGGEEPGSYATPVTATIGGTKQYVIFAAQALLGVRASDGRRLWRVPWVTGCDVNAATPLVAGNRIYITSGYGHGCAVVEAGASSARIVWQNKTIQAHFSSSILYGSRIYGTGDPGNLVCLDPASGRTLWSKSGFEKGGLIGLDGVLLVMCGDSGALAMVKADPSSYQELGRFTPLGGQSWTAPIVAQGKLIVRNKSALACFELR